MAQQNVEPGGRAIAALCCAIAIAIAGCGGSARQAQSQPQGSGANATAVEVGSLLAGISQRGNTLGNPRAPVEVLYFADLQCPFCRRFTLGALNRLIRSYVRGGRLKIEFRSLRTATRDPATFEAQQVAALAAGRQNKLWNFVELFYHEQSRENSGYVNESYLQGLAQQVPGLNLIAWIAARSDPRLANTLAGDARAAVSAGVASTPSFVLGTEGRPSYASAIKRLLTEDLGARSSASSAGSVP